MTSPAAENDPYLLALPGPGSPVVLPRWISDGNTHPGARYADPVWPLAPLIDNPGTRLVKIHWKNCPASLLGEVKLAAWTMINGQLRPTYLQDRGAAARPRASAGETLVTCGEWMRLARWLHERRITSLGECTEEVWRVYLSDRWKGGVSRGHAEKVCGWLSDLWAFDQLSARPAGVARPPWENEGIDDFLPATVTAAGRENTTEPLDPQVLGPLLVWAIRFTDDFADDILAAWAERRRLTALATPGGGTPESRAALEEFLLPLIRCGGALPTVRMHGRRRLASTYISALTGASFGQIDGFAADHRLSALVGERPGSCPLQVEVTGRIGGKPWREHRDYGEAAELMRHLGTAAAILCLYLTGMRPQEVQGLRAGCCPDPEPAADGALGRHLIRSRHYKNVSDDDGNHVSAGAEREIPWVAITPVVRAIRILERMVPPGELLLSGAHHDVALQRGYPGALKYSALNKRIEDFTAWANREAEARGLSGQAIPPDPHGRVGLVRFRRSLAWHIARRPGGLIALAIQYGHMRTVLDARTSSGYGSRSRGGIHSVLDIETALAAADTAARLRDQTAAGEKISGPAARRALTAAATTPRFEGRIVPATFAKKAAAFLARDGIVLFDNPEALLICAFKRENALCEPDPGANAPRQYDCRPGCGNAVRTDTHARLLRERAAELDQLAAAAPGPLGARLTANADRLRETAAAHEMTAQTAKALT
ncbi:integrase [Streptomyces sp. NBC_00989]|uniref:integrase n=1 Tax=Streptomyces sp. NBC_00989 TaxID=2903705 RepID=UPI002F91B937|nr:integrase [Streptomyces sp. NBC_00989]